jgi:hypothetical protein
MILYGTVTCIEDTLFFLHKCDMLPVLLRIWMTAPAQYFVYFSEFGWWIGFWSRHSVVYETDFILTCGNHLGLRWTCALSTPSTHCFGCWWKLLARILRQYNIFLETFPLVYRCRVQNRYQDFRRKNAGYCTGTTQCSGSGIRCFFTPWIRDEFFPDPGSPIPGLLYSYD